MNLLKFLNRERRLTPADDIRKEMEDKQFEKENKEFNEIINFVNTGIKEMADFGYSYFTVVEDVDVSFFYFTQLEKELKLNGYKVSYDKYFIKENFKVTPMQRNSSDKKVMIIEW